tara:strand:+ start:277 stop:531 length:255 start_codon:yes stop_codon:yes gene_type:complete
VLPHHRQKPQVKGYTSFYEFASDLIGATGTQLLLMNTRESMPWNMQLNERFLGKTLPQPSDGVLFPALVELGARQVGSQILGSY